MAIVRIMSVPFNDGTIGVGYIPVTDPYYLEHWKDFSWLFKEVPDGDVVGNDTVLDQARGAEIKKHLPGKHNQKDHAPGHPAVEGQNEYLDSLSTDQLKAIRRYTGGGFTFMNKHLRQGTPTSEENKRKIEVLKGVINNSPPFKQNVELSRFMLRPPEELGMKVGSTFHDKGFTSTTLGKHDYGKWNPEVAMTIHAKAGQHGLHVKEVSGHESENEVILPPGSRFRVTKMTEVVAGKWKVEVELEQ